MTVPMAVGVRACLYVSGTLTGYLIGFYCTFHWTRLSLVSLSADNGDGHRPHPGS